MPELVKRTLPSILYLLLSLLSYKDYYNSLPAGVHAWGQADRYAVAKKYSEYGHKITDIHTYNIVSEDGKTGAELPIVQYLSSLISEAGFEKHLPFLIRFFNWLIFSIGLFVLLESLRFKDWRSKTMIPILIISSPITIFYAYNFLPDSAGLGFIMLLYACLINFIRDHKYIWVLLTLVIGLLASLMKLTVFIFLTASILYFLIQQFRKKRYKELTLTLIPYLGIAWVVRFYVNEYMIAVNEKYWSVVFRAHPNPIQSIQDLVEVVKGMIYWRTEYLSIPLYIILFFALVYNIKQIRKNGIKWKWSGLRLHSLIVLGGLSLFMLKLGKQFLHHDYYFMGSFLPLVIITIVWYLRFAVPNSKLHPGIFRLTLVGLTILAFASSPRVFSERIQDQYKMRKHVIENNFGWLKEAQKAVEMAEMKKEDVLFAFYHASPNLPLVYFDRNGLCFNHEEIQRNQEFVEHWLKTLEPKYIVAPRKWSYLLETDKPHLLPNLTQVFENNDMVLWRCEQKWTSFLSQGNKN